MANVNMPESGWIKVSRISGPRQTTSSTSAMTRITLAVIASGAAAARISALRRAPGVVYAVRYASATDA